MQPIELQITSTRTFGNGFLGYNANTPQGPIEGVVWDAAVQGHFQQGTTIEVMVGASKADGAFWHNYKGKDRLEINKNAQITPKTAAGPQAAPAAPTPGVAPAYQAPATTPPAAPQTAPAPAQAQPAAAPTWSAAEEAVMTKAAQLATCAKNKLIELGWTEEQAHLAAPQLAQMWSSMWFGEKGV